LVDLLHVMGKYLEYLICDLGKLLCKDLVLNGEGGRIKVSEGYNVGLAGMESCGRSS